MTAFHIGVISTMLISQNIEEFCENLVSNFWDAGVVRGVEIYARQDLASLVLVHNLTSGGIQSKENVSLDEESCLAKSYRHREICRCIEPIASISAPIEFQGLLLGVISLTFVNASALNLLQDDQMNVIGAAASGFLDPRLRNANKRVNKPSADGVPPELSVRQMQILQRMSEGQIYSQIARSMHISESLVKLEASRVFKFLGVARKQDAIEAGRKLSTTPPPPPRELVQG